MTNNKWYLKIIDDFDVLIVLGQKRIEFFEAKNLSTKDSKSLSEFKKVVAKVIRNRDSLLRKFRASEGDDQ